jgi:hypothetical protein
MTNSKILNHMEKLDFKKIFIKRNIDIAITVIAILMGAYFGWTIPQMLIFGIFVWVILNPVSSRIPAIVALAFLAFTPFLLVFKRDILAEETAIYAYYFLILTVVMAIYEIRKEDKGDKNDKGKPKS